MVDIIRRAPQPERSTTAARRARQAGGEASRERILDVAEQLFADHGVDGTSIRAVNAAAGFGPAAVNYHFGTKHDLLRAVLRRRHALVIARQVALLTAVEAIDAPPTSEQLVDVIARPFFELLEREPAAGLRWMRIVTDLTRTNDPMVTRHGRPDSFEERLMVQLVRRAPGHDPDELAPRWRLAILALMTLVSASGEEFDAAQVVRFTARGFDGTLEK